MVDAGVQGWGTKINRVGPREGAVSYGVEAVTGTVQVLHAVVVIKKNTGLLPHNRREGRRMKTPLERNVPGSRYHRDSAVAGTVARPKNKRRPHRGSKSDLNNVTKGAGLADRLQDHNRASLAGNICRSRLSTMFVGSSRR